MTVLKVFEWLWSKPPLVWLKPLIMKPLKKFISGLMDELWKRELKKMDWPEPKVEQADDYTEDAFALWEELIIQLANEYEAGEITTEEIASFLAPTGQTFPLVEFKTQKPELLAIMNKIEQKAEIQQINLAQMAEKMLAQTEKKVTQKLDPQKQKALMERLNKLKTEAALAEKQRLAAIAAHPEMIEGITQDQFTSQKQKQETQKKILSHEQKILRSKINQNKEAEKTFKQIGAEKQKAMQKLKEDLDKKSSGSVGSSL